MYKKACPVVRTDVRVNRLAVMFSLFFLTIKYERILRTQPLKKKQIHGFMCFKYSLSAEAAFITRTARGVSDPVR